MSSLKQKSVQCYASIPYSSYSRPPAAGPLPFRSRQAGTRNEISADEQHVRWQDKDASSHKFQVTQDRSPSGNASVKSWLSSTSPTSVIEHAHEERNPATPSPICSPCPSSPVLSPRPFETNTNSEAPSSELETTKVLRNTDHLSAVNRKIKRKADQQNAEVLPGSPTGSTGSSVSEGGLLALLASKLFSYKEHNRPSSRYSRERSGPIDDKHVIEDRGSKPTTEELHTESPLQPEEVQPTSNPLYRTPSEAASELSLGSANDRTLSMEFDAILAAAVAAGVTSALVPAEDSLRREYIHDIQENSSPQSAAGGYLDDAGHERTNETTGVEMGSAAGIIQIALAAAQRGGEIDNTNAENLTEMSSSRSPSRISLRNSSERTEIDSISHQSSSNCSSRKNALGLSPDSRKSASSGNGFGRNDLALTPVDDRLYDANSMVSPSSSERSSKENISPNSSKMALEKVRRDKLLAQVIAYQDAKKSKYDNRFNREEAKINAWENQQRIKAAMDMKKTEMKLEEKRAKALEKMQNDIAAAHKRAEDRKAAAAAVRGMKTAKVAVLTDNLRQIGKTPNGCFPF